MKQKVMNAHDTLSRKIFLYLFGIAFFSIIALSFFWIEDKQRGYYKEVALLKKTFSETKKLETKNKILEIKDYIQWVQNNPLQPVSQELVRQIERFKPTTHVSSSELFENILDILPESFIDSLSAAAVPVYIINDYGKLVFSYNTYGKPMTEKPQKDVITMLQLIQQKSDSSDEGFLTAYKVIEPGDSILEVAGCYTNGILSGLKVATILTSEQFEGILKTYILDSLNKVRFSKDEYVFVNTLDGKALITNGKYNNPPVNILATGDSSWIKIFKVQQSAATRPGGVFYTYTWPKLSTPKTTLKTSFFSFLPEWNWIIGTGFYEDDVNSAIELKRQTLLADMKKAIFHALLYMLISSVLCYILVIFFAKRLGKNIELFSGFFEKAAEGNLLIDKSQVSYREFLYMAEAANLMVEERKKVESELRKSEEKFAKAFNNSPDAITITSLDGQLVEANETIFRVTGHARDELVGGSVIDLNLWADLNDRQKYFELLKESGRVHNLEVGFLMKSGDLRNALISGETININDNKFILSVIRDITERKLAEKALEESETQYRYLFEQNPAPMLIYELGSFMILAVNDAFSNHYGYTIDEALSLKLTDLYPEGEKKVVADISIKLIGLAFAGEWHNLKKDGTIISIETHSHGFSFEGRASRIVVINDITKRKQVEEKVLQLNMELENRVNDRTAQLASINKDLESFSYSISHDLRAPLRAIFGFSQILSSRHRDSLNEEGKQYMDYIVEACTRMEQLINDLLNYSRLGRKAIVMHEVSLNSIVISIYDDFKNQLKEIGGKLIITKNLPVILGDETLLRQIFTNLVGNSIKYRRNDTPLKVTINSVSTTGGCLIEVADNGIGIPKVHWEKIFNVFQRLHNEDKYPGTGIGLATVKKAVNMLGGTVYVESMVGKGSAFFIKLTKTKF